MPNQKSCYCTSWGKKQGFDGKKGDEKKEIAENENIGSENSNHIKCVTLIVLNVRAAKKLQCVYFFKVANAN